MSARAVDLGNNTTVSSPLTFTVEPDRDGDGLGDNEEVNNYNTLPDNADTDGDSLSDGREVQLGTHPLLEDTDGLRDGTEIANDIDPFKPRYCSGRVLPSFFSG